MFTCHLLGNTQYLFTPFPHQRALFLLGPIHPGSDYRLVMGPSAAYI